jgi:translocation and assembly module TamB
MSEYRLLTIRIALTLVKALLALMLLAVVLVGTGLTTQIFTRPIAARLVVELNARTGLELSYKDIEGVPISDLRITGLTARLGTTRVMIEDVQLVWNPFELFSGLVDITTLNLSDASLVIDNSTTTTNEELSLTTIQPLGIEIRLAEFIVDKFTLQTADRVVTLDALQASLEVDDQAISVSRIFMRLNDNELTGSIGLEIGNKPLLNADLAWYSPFVLSVIPQSVLQLVPQLPSEIPSGQLQLSGWTDQLRITHTLNTPVAAISSGILNSPLRLDELEFTFEHTIDALELALIDGSLTTLNGLLVTSSGDLDRQLFQTSASIDDARLSAVNFSATTALGQSALQINPIQLQTATGIVNASFNIDFANAIQISGSYALEDTDPLSLLNTTTPFELANLSSNGDFNASLVAQEWNGRLRVTELAGELSGYPLQGNASLSLLNSALVIEQLLLATNDNSLSIAGNLTDTAGVSWSLEAPALNQILPDASGSMSGSGSFSTAAGNVNIAGSLIANAIEYQSYYGDSVKVEFDFNNDSVSANVELQAIGNEQSNELVTSANLDLKGNPAQHTLSGIVNSPFLSLNSALQGSLSQSGPNWQWSGSVATTELNSSYGMWQLQSALQLSLNDRFEITVDGGCFAQAQTRFCARVAGGLQDSLEAELSLEGFQLSRFNHGDLAVTANPFITPPLPLLPPGFLIQGEVTGRLLTTFGASSPAIELNIESSGTQLSIDSGQFPDAQELAEQDYERQSYQVERFSISATGSLDKLGLSSLIEINEISLNDEPLAAPGRIDSQLLISDLRDLEGEVNINLPSLDWIEAIAPGASNVGGSLVSNISIGGDIEQPLLGGRIQFTNLALNVDALGIRLFNANLSVEQSQSNRYSLVGSLNSGEGAAAVTGELENLFLPSWSADAKLTGNNFLFINRPELTMAASPEITLAASGQLIDIRGSLGVPILKLDVEGLPDTAIDVSRDAVITNYSTSASSQDVYVDERSLFAIPIMADINVALENDVSFSGFGITAKLGGEINYRQSATGASSTYGELTILSGSYQAYQQELTIKQGQLLFFGALDNPALDIRAIREVNSVTVGVLMNGTLKSINSQLFSTPALPENDIISLIATGRKFSSIGEGDGVNVLNTIANLGLNRSQGLTDSMRDKLGLDALQITNTGDINNSVLTVGKFVTPDIFIRYGVGLFDNQSKISVDYTLSEHLKLQAESGEFQSIDITYTVEK